MIKSWITPASISLKRGLRKYAHKFTDGPDDDAYEYIDLLYTYKEAADATKRAQGDRNGTGDKEPTDESDEEDSGEEIAEDAADASTRKNKAYKVFFYCVSYHVTDFMSTRLKYPNKPQTQMPQKRLLRKELLQKQRPPKRMLRKQQNRTPRKPVLPKVLRSWILLLRVPKNNARKTSARRVFNLDQSLCV